MSKLIATFFGLGYIPIAPGTFGAIGGFLVSLSFYYLNLSYQHSVLYHFMLILIFYFLGVWATNEVSKEWGSDPSRVVVDETIGFWITIFLFKLTLFNLIVGLILFRIFDIWKPLGIKKIDNLSHNGHAVMLDDVLAGVYSAIGLFVLNKLNINTWM